jgi:hypothetical protein
MSRIKTRKGLLSAGLLLMGLTIALGSLAVGYGLWAKVLTISGTVHTGEVNAEWSVEEVDESSDFNAICPPGSGSGEFSIGQDCDGDGELNDDMELEGKDIADCNVTLITRSPPDLDNPGSQLMQVTIDNAYPSFNCFVRWDIHNNGTIPIKIHSPQYNVPNPSVLHVNGWPPPCYANDTQLEPSEVAYCSLHVHVNQPAEMDTDYTFSVEVFAHQWNEEPPLP